MKKIIKPKWKNHKYWEDFVNGMYENRLLQEKVMLCYEILTSENLKEKMEETTKSYTISTEINFTNKMFNPISWLGQATCNLIYEATAKETINAWLSMTKEEQIRANNIAKEVIEEWRTNYENI